MIGPCCPQDRAESLSRANSLLSGSYRFIPRCPPAAPRPSPGLWPQHQCGRLPRSSVPCFGSSVAWGQPRSSAGLSWVSRRKRTQSDGYSTKSEPFPAQRTHCSLCTRLTSASLHTHRPVTFFDQPFPRPSHCAPFLPRLGFPGCPGHGLTVAASPRIMGLYLRA